MKTHPKPKNSSESLPAKGEPFSSCAPFAVSKRTPQREKLAHIRGEGKGKSKERGKANHCACGLPLLFPLRSLERFPGLKVGANNFGGGGGSLRETSSATFFEGMSFFRCVCVCVCVCVGWLVVCVFFCRRPLSNSAPAPLRSSPWGPRPSSPSLCLGSSAASASTARYLLLLCFLLYMKGARRLRSR